MLSQPELLPVLSQGEPVNRAFALSFRPLDWSTRVFLAFWVVVVFPLVDGEDIRSLLAVVTVYVRHSSQQGAQTALILSQALGAIMRLQPGD